MQSSASKQQSTGPKSDKSFFTRFLDTVEYLGNLLPHPVTLFAILCLFIFFASGIAGYFDLSVIDPRPEGSRTADGFIYVNSLVNPEGVQLLVTNLVKNFTSFAPLGTVLVAMMGVAVAEHSGLLSAIMRSMVIGASHRMVTVTVVFTGIISNTAAELGYVVLIPLAAMIFHSLGRHPIAGLAAAFAGVSGGYSANLLLGTVDPLLSGITEASAQMIDPTYTVGPEANWYFMFVSTFVISILGAWVTEKIVEPKLGKYDQSMAAEDFVPDEANVVTSIEKRGIRFAGLAALVVAAILALTVVPEWGILRNPETGAVAGSPFLKGIVAFIFVFFAIPGFVYGKVTGSMKNDRDVIDAMAKSISSMGLYIVLVFFAAQFVALFNWTNFGQVIAVAGASFLQNIEMTGPVLFFAFIVMCGVINLTLGSASAQWAITAPIFIPMLMLVGYAPETIQAAYRIGDSVTNLITPMMSYFGLILAVATRYKRDLGIGTLIATMLPYTLVFLVGWSLFFYLWVFVAGLPVGPGSATYFQFDK